MECRELNSRGSGLGRVVSTTVKLWVPQNVRGFSTSQESRPADFLKILCSM